MQQFSKLRTDAKLSEMVHDQLEQAILTGKLKVNEQLPTLIDLCGSFGVSRTVVREAMQRLQAQGLVECRMGSGSYVAPYPIAQVNLAMRRFAAMNPERENFLHLLDLRSVIETETCARFVEKHDPHALLDLRLILERMDKCKDRLDEFAKADVEFHLRISQASDNPFFPTILEAMKSVGQAFGIATYESADVVERTIADHAAIYAALEAGDPERARQTMGKHLAFSQEHYLELLSRRDANAQTPIGVGKSG